MRISLIFFCLKMVLFPDKLVDVVTVTHTQVALFQPFLIAAAVCVITYYASSLEPGIVFPFFL